MARQSVLAVIPARGGSKGLPGKNIMTLAGKPLIAWSIEAALACPEVDRLVLSSDDPEIIAVARTLGCDVPFVRPASLSTDEASSMDVILHTLESLPESYDWVVVLQPTSPLRLATDITACLACAHAHHAPACVTVAPTKPPHWNYFLTEEQGMMPVLDQDTRQKSEQAGRQQLPPAYALNGAVYAAQCCWFQKNRAFVTTETRASIMPVERSVDVDTALDFKLAGLLLEER